MLLHWRFFMLLITLVALVFVKLYAISNTDDNLNAVAISIFYSSKYFIWQLPG